MPPMRLHSGLIYAILAAVLIYLMLWKTTLGYRMRACGAQPLAARYAGMSVKRHLVLAMLLRSEEHTSELQSR